MSIPTRRIVKRDWVRLPFFSRRPLRSRRITNGVHKPNSTKAKRKQKIRLRAALSNTSLHRTPEEMTHVEVVTRDPDRPQCHVMPLSGWMNDPNGPIYYRGRYHLFYQHVPNRVEWDWGLVWGHACSEDLITWEHLPIALEPSHGGHDHSGCFSGTCVKNGDGVPIILYTGAKLRSHHTDDLPPPEFDLNLPFIETQLAAVADASDDFMVKWTKLEQPILHLPPANAELTGWRDPFIFRHGNAEDEWLMLIGSGLKGKGGTVLKYTASDLLSEWKFAGQLCVGDADTGAMWECPLLKKLRPYRGRPIGQRHDSAASNGGSKPVDIAAKFQHLALDADDVDEQFSYFFCVSPDAPTNPVLYWLGHLDENDEFQIDKATQPLRLDLGDIVYAPNLMEDENGDTLLWTWLQERRTVGSYDYAGCMGVPRKLTIKRDKLMQEPADKILQLRTTSVWEAANVPLFPEETVPVEGVRGQALDMEVVLEKGTSDAAGLLIRSWRVGGEGTAAIVFDWERSVLEVVFEALNPETMEFYLDPDNSRCIGGRVDWRPGEPLRLRILLDHSCLEIFTGSGEALSTRVYRGAPVQQDDTGLDFVSFGGTATLSSVCAYEMQSIWKEDAALSPVTSDPTKGGAPFFGMPEMEMRSGARPMN